MHYSHIAQSVERLIVNQNVVGSSPTVRACPDVDANFLLSRSHYLGRMLLKGEHNYIHWSGNTLFLECWLNWYSNGLENRHS